MHGQARERAMDDFDLEVQCEEYYGPEVGDWLEYLSLAEEENG
jgi:hypothetical protein